ncbi:integrase, catalytic region, zinc finger, CCHC-type containing protein [Tanacetum coccineum]
MAALKFASSHNMVAFLDKPTESDGFEQIVDILNAHPIKYALTVNPTIYTACIKQFWTTAKVQTVNGEVPDSRPYLSQRVLALETTKTSQAIEITKLKERVKKLERRNKSRTPGLKSIRSVLSGKGNGENIMKSLMEGPFHMGYGLRCYCAGTDGAVQKVQYVLDRVLTTFLAEAKEKMILEGSELTKDDRESHLYDEFEYFCQIKRRRRKPFTMQRNSKFVNNMLSEWSRFITKVKLNRGLKESNFDQLYAYLKQHEVHANENRTMMEKAKATSVFRLLQAKDDTNANAQEYGVVLDEGTVVVLQGETDVTALIEQNECVRVELEKVKQHYKELYDSIKITRAHTSEKTSTMLNEIESLKAQLKSKVSCVTSDSVKPKVLAPGMYAIDVKPIPHPLKNNRSAHLTYINHLKESVETVREIVEEARVVKPLDNALNYACQYTKLSQELLEYVIGTCPKSFNERDNKAPSTPVTRKKQVTFNDKPGTSSSNTQKHGVHQKAQQSNVQVIPSTGVSSSTRASGSKPRSNTKKNRILPAKSENKKKVEDHPRTNKSVWTKVNRVDSSISSKRVVINSNSESVCKTCNKCLNSANHKMCVVNILSSVNATPTVKIVLNKGKQIWKPKGKLSDNSLNKTKRVWKATGKLFADIGYQWRPTGKKFALGELCPLTKLSVKCCSKHMTGNRSKLKNFVEKFIGTVRFGNDHFGAIMGYGDYVIGDSVISRVYYVEGLGHNLFFVGQFCDSDLEIAFRKHSCFVRDMNGVDLLKGSRSTNLYMISIDDMMKSSPVCLLSKASKTKSWLWHRRLNHLNFGTINDLA